MLSWGLKGSLIPNSLIHGAHLHQSRRPFRRNGQRVKPGFGMDYGLDQGRIQRMFSAGDPDPVIIG